MLLNRIRTNRFKIAVILVIGFWYLSLYPGRLGFDYAEMARLIRRGESTAWWGASFFWYFKFLTFNLHTIAILSLLGLLALATSLWFLISTLNIGDSIKKRVFFIVICTPLYGVFGASVSHDVYQASGILILTGLCINSVSQKKAERREFVYLTLAALYMTTTQHGLLIFVIIVLLLSFTYQRMFALSLILLLTVHFCSNAFINNKSTSSDFAGSFVVRFMLIDLKCIVQHPQAEISANDWDVLLKYSTKEKWTKPVSCSSPDVLGDSIGILNKSFKYDSELTNVFVRAVSKQAAIPVMSHIQRASVALPPPFFQPPQNQISWDLTQPIGLNTNVALQAGPELLHPSIDDPFLSHRPGILRPLELFALFPTFLINQASWFWGWGGLWMWPILFLVVFVLGYRRMREVIVIFLPTLLLHFIIVVIGPTSLGRYVMSTVLFGFGATLMLIFKRLGKRSSHAPAN